MSADSLTDSVVVLLSAWLAERINDALAESFAPDAPVSHVIGYPIDVGNALAALGNQSLPLLSVSVASAKAPRPNKQASGEAIEVQITYVMKATPGQQLASRWPALRRVWMVLRAALEDGLRSDGTPVDLEGVGILGVAQERDWYACEFGWLDGATTPYPSFSAQVKFDYMAPSSPAVSQPLLELYTSLSRLPDGGNPALQPQVVSRALAP